MNQLINNALTQETPGKVMALLGTAMFSLAFLFAVASTDIGFNGSTTEINDPFSMQNVVSGIDSIASAYDKFLYANLVQPAEETYALYADNLAWLADNSGVTYALGFSQDSQTQPVVSGQVAGASTIKYQAKNSGMIDLLYHTLTQ